MKVDWSQAGCRLRDPEDFFLPEREEIARLVCFSCTIRLECLNYALTKPERFGVWGGSTESERRRYGWRKHRVRCPGCGSLRVDQMQARVEVCRSCGLSWPV